MSNLAVLTVAMELGSLVDEGVGVENNARQELTEQISEIYEAVKIGYNEFGLDCKMLSMQFVKQSNVLNKHSTTISILEAVAVVEGNGENLQSQLDRKRVKLGYKQLKDYFRD